MARSTASVDFDPRFGEQCRRPRSRHRGDILVCEWAATAVALRCSPSLPITPGRPATVVVDPGQPLTVVLAVADRVVRREGSDRALMIDPGDEADKLLGAVGGWLGVQLDAILLTHTHFDHVGAVAPVARATGAEVWVPKIEAFVLADVMS